MKYWAINKIDLLFRIYLHKVDNLFRSIFFASALYAQKHSFLDIRTVYRNKISFMGLQWTIGIPKYLSQKDNDFLLRIKLLHYNMNEV